MSTPVCPSHPPLPAATRAERVQLCLIWLFLGLVPLFLRPLWEPDEARYAEIPREMLATGNWLTPHLNGVLYSEKPPLQYWLSALSMKAFGLHAAAARLPIAIATLLLIWCTWRLARRVGARRPVWSVFMVSTALLVFICHQILTLDALFSALLLASLVAALEAVLARSLGDGRRAMAWTLVTFGANALALLTKGLAAPVLLGGMLAASLPWAWRDRGLRRAILRLLFDPAGWLFFVAVGAPWFVLVERANPGHAWFFFVHEHLQRYATHIHGRQGSSNPILDKLYFAGILAAGLLPWLGVTLRGLRRTHAFLFPKGETSRDALQTWMVAALAMAFVVPLLFFTFSGSKLPPYILPAAVPILLLAGVFECDQERWTDLRRTGWELLGLGTAFILASPFFAKVEDGTGWMLLLGTVFLGLGAWAVRPVRYSEPRWMAAVAVGFLTLSMTAQKVAGPGKEVSHLVRQAPADAQWISCGNYFQGIGFEARTRVAVVAGTGELAFGRDHLTPTERARWFQDDLRALDGLAGRLRRETPSAPVWALVSRNVWKDIPPDERQVWEPVDHTSAAWLVRFR